MKLRVGDLPNKRKMKIRTFDISKFHQQNGTKKIKVLKALSCRKIKQNKKSRMIITTSRWLKLQLFP